MSEVTTAMRHAIRGRILEELGRRPGQWLTTQELLQIIDEAETSSVLAGLCADMARGDRLARGPKTINQEGRLVNTWGLDKSGYAALASGDGAPGPEAGTEPVGCREVPGGDGGPTWRPLEPIGTEPQPLPVLSFEDEAPRARAPGNVGQKAEARAGATPAEVAAFAEALGEGGKPDQGDAAGDFPHLSPSWLSQEEYWLEPLPPKERDAVDQNGTVTAGEATDTDTDPGPAITLPVLPGHWLPEMTLRLRGTEDDATLTLRFITEGAGAYWSMKTNHKVAWDPGDADFLPTLCRGLCAVLDTLAPPQTTAVEFSHELLAVNPAKTLEQTR